MDELKEEKPKCENCARGEEWITKKDPKNPGIGGNRTGFFRCSLFKSLMVTYFAGRLSCQLTPPRYERRADQQ